MPITPSTNLKLPFLFFCLDIYKNVFLSLKFREKNHQSRSRCASPFVTFPWWAMNPSSFFFNQKMQFFSSGQFSSSVVGITVKIKLLFLLSSKREVAQSHLYHLRKFDFSLKWGNILWKSPLPAPRRPLHVSPGCLGTRPLCLRKGRSSGFEPFLTWVAAPSYWCRWTGIMERHVWPAPCSSQHRGLSPFTSHTPQGSWSPFIIVWLTAPLLHSHHVG